MRLAFWWWAEQHAGHLWHHACRDGVTCRLDWLPAYCTRRRYAAERRRHPELFAR